MHQEKYSLTWHTYSDHLKSMMKELMMNEDYSDVTLITEDKKQIKANINVLSACSPVFKDILKKEKNSSTIMYLRGIQYLEMESIMQFIYLGEATFHEERMDEFIAVAKSLEIKELCNAETETNDEPEDEPTTNDPETLNEILPDQTLESDRFIKHPPPEKRREVDSINSKYGCIPCHKSFTSRKSLYLHDKSVHEGVKYACDQCDYESLQKSNLTIHIQSKHEGIKYACDQCEYETSHKGTLTVHIQSRHEGIKYACDQCDLQFSKKSHLKRHVMNKHQVVQ